MKIVFKKIKFNVNKENKTVSCIITASFVSNSSVDNYISSRWTNAGFMENNNFTVAGVSKCHPSDTFDETKGKRIAESRAKKLVYEFGKQEAKKLKKLVEIYLKEIDESIEFSKVLKSREQDHINLLSSGN